MGTQGKTPSFQSSSGPERIVRRAWRRGFDAALVVVALAIVSCSSKESESKDTKSSPDAKSSPKEATLNATSPSADKPAPPAPAMEPVSFQAAINVDAGAKGDVIVLDPKINHIRFENLTSTDGESKIYDIQFHLPLGKVAKGDKFQISFESKAERDRTADLSAIVVGTPKNLGFGKELKLTKAWQPVNENFECIEEGPNGAITFNVGNDDAPIEIRKIIVKRVDGD